MNHTSKLSQLSGKGLNNLTLIQGLRNCHIRWGVAKEHESWITMKDVYRSINKITKTDAHTKAYHEPRYNSFSEVIAEEVNEVSYNRGKKNIHMTILIIALISGNNIMTFHIIDIKTICPSTELQSK